MAGPVAFVGRAGELPHLLAAIHGDTRLVLVVGDAGIGKTRFTAEGMTRAAAAGTVIARGECLPLAEALPLLPVAAALGELARLEDGRPLAEALDGLPGYVREEAGRLLPWLSPDGGPGPAGAWDEGLRRSRLFSAVGELLDAVASQSGHGLAVVIEDVHWADDATLDCLTFLIRGGCRGAVTVIVTCRSDEAPVAGHVASWLAQARSAARVEEIRLAPLSRGEVARLVTALAGGPVPPGVVAGLYARAEGNPFFTEQLVAAALAGVTAEGATAEALGVPAGLPGRLAELLAARARRCAAEARAVLAGLAVAGRPLGEDLLGAVTTLDAAAVRAGLRELAGARLLADDTTGGAHRPRHALLAEAVAGGLLPGERAALHERTARALAAAGDERLAAEVAGHWAAAGRPAEELPARVAAAETAERLSGYSEAAVHWQRAIGLVKAQPGTADAAGIDVPRVFLRAIDALYLAGDGERASAVAEEAYRRFAGHPDPRTAAVVRHRAAFHRAFESPPAGLPLIEEALRLFEQAPPSAEQAEAWLDYADKFLGAIEGRLDGAGAALNRALEIAEAVGATVLIPRTLERMGAVAFRRGQIDEGFAFLERASALARATADGPTLVRVAVTQSDVLLKLARFSRAAEVALRSLGSARQAGLEASFPANVVAGNAAEALLASGRTAEAAALIDPLTTGPPDRLHWLPHEARTEIDMLRGDLDAAARRRSQVDAVVAESRHVEFARESAQRAAELALWAGRPGDALDNVRRALPQLKDPNLAIFCGRLLTVGMRACADLAERARARREAPAAAAAAAAATDLASWASEASGALFTGHPFVATIPAELVTWDAERTRLAGTSDPEAWRGAAKAWQDLGCPHRAGYAWWRQAQAQLNRGQPVTAAAAALRSAAAAADGHAPLLEQVRLLAERARIPLQSQPAAVVASPGPAQVLTSYGLTSRELAVLRLLAAGHTNAQIGAELYISPKTAGVHVSNILRKLGVASRVQAATLAERAGLLDCGQP